LLAFENRLDCQSPFAIVVNCEDPELQMLPPQRQGSSTGRPLSKN
jgi:hypothetical protein